MAAVRDTAKARSKLPSDVRLVQVDLKDPASVQAAVLSSGATRVFGLIDVVGKAQLQALKTGGVTHFVYVSTSFIGLPTEPMALQQWQSGAENAIRSAGFTYTFLRCEAFMSNCNKHRTHGRRATTLALSPPRAGRLSHMSAALTRDYCCPSCTVTPCSFLVEEPMEQNRQRHALACGRALSFRSGR